VGDRITYRTKAATYKLKVTSVKKSGGKVRGGAVALTAMTVASGKTKTLTLPSQCTVGGVRVDVTEIGSKLTGKFKNVTCLVVGPKVVVIGAKAFAKAKKVKKLKVKSARLRRVTNCLKGSKVKKVNVRAELSKKRQKTYRKWFTKKCGKKGVSYSYKAA
jgi:hypothetical protein